MARLPDVTTFQCESCRAVSQTTPRKEQHLLPWMRRLPIQPDGSCRKCGGKWWKITVSYLESDLEVSTSPGAWLWSMVTFSAPLAHNTAASQEEFARVSAETVAAMNADPTTRTVMVGEFISAAHRIEMHEQGAKNCKQCGAVFVPVAEIVWSERGYCSKVCFIRREGQLALNRLEPAVEGPRSNTIHVACIAGHPFSVARSFVGTKRPCPVCGEKTEIPDL